MISPSTESEHEYLMFFYMHKENSVTRFHFLLYLPYLILTLNQFGVYHFQNICSLYNSLLSVEVSHRMSLQQHGTTLCSFELLRFHDNSDCHLAKIRQTCSDYTRVLEISWFICQNQVNDRRFIGVLITSWLFNKAFKVKNIIGNCNRTVIFLYIKISDNNEMFIIIINVMNIWLNFGSRFLCENQFYT